MATAMRMVLKRILMMVSFGMDVMDVMDDELMMMLMEYRML